jgi:hypothetical protein
MMAIMQVILGQQGLSSRHGLTEDVVSHTTISSECFATQRQLQSNPVMQ